MRPFRDKMTTPIGVRGVLIRYCPAFVAAFKIGHEQCACNELRFLGCTHTHPNTAKHTIPVVEWQAWQKWSTNFPGLLHTRPPVSFNSYHSLYFLYYCAGIQKISTQMRAYNEIKRNLIGWHEMQQCDADGEKSFKTSLLKV